MTTSSTEMRDLPTLRIKAINSASESAGSIHDDAKAREMGYRGGLVPGVTIMGYMSRLMYENFASAWTEGGTFHGLLRRPVYEGDEVIVEGVAWARDTEGQIVVEIKVIDPDGNICAHANATCRAESEAQA